MLALTPARGQDLPVELPKCFSSLPFIFVFIPLSWHGPLSSVPWVTAFSCLLAGLSYLFFPSNPVFTF